MIRSISITNPRGELLTLELENPGSSGFSVQGVEGLGSPKSMINISESLYEDGGFFNSARVSPRNIVLTLGFFNDSETETIEEIRNKTYRFFPSKTPLLVEVVTDTRTGVTIGYVESNEVDIFSKESGTVISLLCPDAYFYSKNTISTVFSGVASAFEFPFENTSLTEKTLVFGNVFISTAANVQYLGDTPTGVTIYINFLGAVTNPIIHNLSTGANMAIDSAKLIALTGSGFVAGDQLVVSTRKNNKSITLIRAGVAINILNAVNILADWFQITRGNNVFSYSASSGSSNIQMYIEHQLLYEGL